MTTQATFKLILTIRKGAMAFTIMAGMISAKRMVPVESSLQSLVLFVRREIELSLGLPLKGHELQTAS